MKTKYLITLAAAVGGLFLILKFKKKNLVNKAEDQPNKQSVTGENHIRSIMKKSKLAV